jgi:hypothetical protein
VQSQKIIEALLTARQVAEAKHSAYTGRLNDDRLANMTLEGMASLLREFGDSAATVTPNERAKVAALFFNQLRNKNQVKKYQSTFKRINRYKELHYAAFFCL